jgi:hypothetical protein
VNRRGPDDTAAKRVVGSAHRGTVAEKLDHRPWRPPTPQARRAAEELDALIDPIRHHRYTPLVYVDLDGSRQWITIDELLELMGGAA